MLYNSFYSNASCTGLGAIYLKKKNLSNGPMALKNKYSKTYPLPRVFFKSGILYSLSKKAEYLNFYNAALTITVFNTHRPPLCGGTLRFFGTRHASNIYIYVYKLYLKFGQIIIKCMYTFFF